MQRKASCVYIYIRYKTNNKDKVYETTQKTDNDARAAADSGAGRAGGRRHEVEAPDDVGYRGGHRPGENLKL